MPEREKEICQRLRGIRLDSKFPQVVFAEKLGIKGPRLASYELGRVPVRFDIAIKSAAICRVSLRWLAEGVEPKSWYIHTGKEIRDQIPDSLLFSEAYDKWLKKLFDEECGKISKITGGRFDSVTLEKFGDISKFRMLHFLSPEEFASNFAHILKHTVNHVPQHLFGGLWDKLTEQTRIFLSEHEGEIEDWGSISKGAVSNVPTPNLKMGKLSCEDVLDIRLSVLDTDGVKTKIRSLPDLISALRKSTKERGSKSALARKLKVSRQAVDQWLCGKSKPSAEVMLELLKWAEQQ